jgi:PleD family two-component response regulator
VHREDLPHITEVFTRSIAFGNPYQLEQRLRRFATMSDPTSTVLVIDDDPDQRTSVERLLRPLGINVQLFGSIPTS